MANVMVIKIGLEYYTGNPADTATMIDLAPRFERVHRKAWDGPWSIHPDQIPMVESMEWIDLAWPPPTGEFQGRTELAARSPPPCGLRATTSHLDQIDYDCDACGYSITATSGSEVRCGYPGRSGNAAPRLAWDDWLKEARAIPGGKSAREADLRLAYQDGKAPQEAVDNSMPF